MKPLACLCPLACLADLPRQGIASEIVLTALARAGYTAEISIMPWSRALVSVYQGNRDGVVGVWSTAERRASPERRC